MIITSEQLKDILRNCRNPEMWSELMNEILPIYGIEDLLAVASFVAQVGHESSHLNILEENLNYSAEGLLRVFPKYFRDPEIAKRYARNPNAIASRVYANRMGNGDESSGDGWKYRGRGAIQCTGKQNYEKCSLELFDNAILLDEPDMLLEPRYALMSACWFWRSRNLNEFAHDIIATTKKINGGTHGLQDRTELYELAQEILDA